jgi:hypothetical protein
MSVSDPSIALSGGGLTPQQQASDIFGQGTSRGYPSQDQLDDAAYLELSGAASTLTVQQVNVSEPPNLAAAAALMSQLTAAIQSRSSAATSAFEVLSAATTLTLTAE